VSFKNDGTFTSATLDGPGRKSFPIPGDNVSFIVEQEFLAAFANFAPLALNTAHATYTDAYLVSESPLQDLGGGIAKWTRTYAQVPAARNEFETFSYQFPGLLGSSNPPYDQYWVADTGGGRDPRTEVVTSRLHYEYFLIGDGGAYATVADIPQISAQEYTLVANPNARIPYLLAAGIYLSDSTPTKEAYLEMIDAGTELVAEDSRVERYMGNIWCRITRYVVAL
jgi:hypothetical protein